MDTATVARFSIILRLRPLLLLLRTHQVCACVKLRMRFVCMRFVCVCVVCVVWRTHLTSTRSLFRHSRILPVIDCWRAVVLVVLPPSRVVFVLPCVRCETVCRAVAAPFVARTHTGG